MSLILPLLIVDDEKPARDNLRFLLGKLGLNQTLEIYEASSAIEARVILEHHKISLIFLDIQMPEEDGFEFLFSIPHHAYAIIFTTAYNQFAIKAFRAGALDYLLKPVDFTELTNAVKEVLKRMLNPHISVNLEEEKILLQKLHQQTKTKKIDTIIIAAKSGFTPILISDICYLEADSNYTIFHLSNLKKVVASKPLKEFEDIIEGNSFFRIHKSYLINLQYFKQISKVDPTLAIMSDGSNLPISRRKLNGFIEAITFHKMPNDYE